MDSTKNRKKVNKVDEEQLKIIELREYYLGQIILLTELFLEDMFDKEIYARMVRTKLNHLIRATLQIHR